MRVTDLANELGVSCAQLIEELGQLGVWVQGDSADLNTRIVGRVREAHGQSVGTDSSVGGASGQTGGTASRGPNPLPGELWFAWIPFEDKDGGKVRPCVVVRCRDGYAEVMPVT